MTTKNAAVLAGALLAFVGAYNLYKLMIVQKGKLALTFEQTVEIYAPLAVGGYVLLTHLGGK